MTRIFYIDVSVFSNAALFCAYFKKVSPDRQRKINSLKNQRDKVQSLGAYICYMEAMRLFNADISSPWGYSAKGKPYFKDDTHLSFSLSHSEDIAAAVLSDRRVGIDVEGIRDFREGVCRKYFAKAEARYVMSADDIFGRQERFFRLWTLKEAYAKMTGMGVGSFADFEIIPTNPPTVRSSEEYIDAYFSEFDINGYKCAVCTEGAEEDMQISGLGIYDLLIK